MNLVDTLFVAGMAALCGGIALFDPRWALIALGTSLMLLAVVAAIREASKKMAERKP